MKLQGIILAVVALTLACGSGASNSADDAVRRQFGYLDKGQWGLQWEEMHPAQQAIVTRECFISDSAEEKTGIEIEVRKILETYEEDIEIPGTDLLVPSTAVTLKLEVRQGLLSDTITETFHEVLVDGDWRWLSSNPERISGAC